MEYILSIDQGTTASRAIIYDKNGNKQAGAYKELTQYFPQPGWVEHNPEELWQGVRQVMQEALAQLPKGSIRAIGITNQRETTVVWDRDTGKPLCNAIVWQCRRTAPRCDALRKRKGEQEFFRERTGLPIDPYFSATKIEWMLKNVSGALDRARAGKLLFGTIDTWILWNLTNGAVHATDFTNASRTMLFNIGTLRWDKDILKKFSIPQQMLPAVQSSSGIFGVTAKHGSLPAGIPIAGMAGDQQAALFGQACFEPGTLKNTYGTGCFLLLNTGRRRVASRHGLITTLGCGAAGQPVYALEGAVFAAGAAVQWLRDGLGLLRQAAQSEAMAQAVRDNAGVYFVPAFSGLGAPYWDAHCRGSIFGLTRGTQKGHLARAALEAMCYQTKDVITAMRKDSGLKINSLKIDGGAAANNFLCQFQADILGMEVARPKIIESTSLGAASLAGLGAGFWKDAEEIRKCWKLDRVFKPQMSSKTAAALYRGWLDAVSRTLSTNAL